jgi:hypothetical protein
LNISDWIMHIRFKNELDSLKKLHHLSDTANLNHPILIDNTFFDWEGKQLFPLCSICGVHIQSLWAKSHSLLGREPICVSII